MRLVIQVACACVFLGSGPANAGSLRSSPFTANHVIHTLAQHGVRVEDMTDSRPTCPKGYTCGYASGFLVLSPPRVTLVAVGPSSLLRYVVFVFRSSAAAEQTIPASRVSRNTGCETTSRYLRRGNVVVEYVSSVRKLVRGCGFRPVGETTLSAIRGALTAL